MTDTTENPNTDRPEDEGRDEAALWSEFDQAEANAAAEPPPDAGRAGDEWDAAAGEPSGERAAEGGDDTRQQEGSEPDLWANATPEQRAAFEAAREQYEQYKRSNEGRISAYQRQVAELMAAQRPSPPAAEQAAEGQGASGQGGPAQAEGFLASAKWKDFAEEYPEVAGPLAEVIGGLHTHTSRLEQELSAILAERRRSELNDQAAILANEHPDWEEVTADRTFVDWLQGQPRHIQEATYRNAENIVDAAEAADVVGRFKAHRGGEPNTPRANARGTENNQALAGKRARQLESASAARSRGPGAASGIPEDGDPETIWKQFDELERRQART